MRLRREIVARGHILGGAVEHATGAECLGDGTGSPCAPGGGPGTKERTVLGRSHPSRLGHRSRPTAQGSGKRRASPRESPRVAGGRVLGAGRGTVDAPLWLGGALAPCGRRPLLVAGGLLPGGAGRQGAASTELRAPGRVTCRPGRVTLPGV